MTKNEIKELSCQFGEHRQLTGVVTEPLDAAPRIACVLINAGLIPRFGPFRLYTQLARRLSSEGLLTLRFDLGGIGDSGQGYVNFPLKKRTELEIRAALDYLHERHELDGVILGGLCSGAEDSFRYAEIDPRITGLILMDPFGFRTLGWWSRELPHQIARHSLRMLRRVLASRRKSHSAALINYKHMNYAEASRILRVLVRRKVPMHFVYTGGMSNSFNHKSQFQTMFGEIDFEGLVTLNYFPEMGHTQVLEAERRLVIESIADNVIAHLRGPMSGRADSGQ